MAFNPDIPYESRYGTTSSGNLPANKHNKDGVDPSKAGHCYKLCPYSTDNTTSTQPVKTEHTQTKGRMRTQPMPGVTGWMCWDDNCYFYTTLKPGRRYFES